MFCTKTGVFQRHMVKRKGRRHRKAYPSSLMIVGLPSSAIASGTASSRTAAFQTLHHQICRARFRLSLWLAAPRRGYLQASVPPRFSDHQRRYLDFKYEKQEEKLKFHVKSTPYFANAKYGVLYYCSIKLHYVDFTRRRRI